jgi:hypothetical protein
MQTGADHAALERRAAMDEIASRRRRMASPNRPRARRRQSDGAAIIPWQ